MLAIFISVFLLVKSDASWPWWVFFIILLVCQAIGALNKAG